MMLHTDLDHLSGSMREELRRVTALLFEGFDDLCAQKRAQRYRTARIDKLILYGAHAARDLGASPILTPAPIRLLVIVNHNRIAARRDDWAPIRDRLRRAWEVGEILHPVRLCVHTLSHVNHALVHGVPWFVTIASDGIALYQASSARLEAPRRLPAARRRERGHTEFTRWYERAGDFLIGAAFFEQRGNAPMAALLLHQANEHLYQCVAWSLTLNGLRTHALDELREVAEYLDSRLVLAWPQETPFERRVFGCIRRAYVEVRYGRTYRIAPEEVAWAMDCTAALYKLVQSVCVERLDALNEISQEADHVQFA
ncbi:HEPN domain-containing protein [Sphingomonas sp. H39-1-10]|jgi:HEPN domain-containing protein|uniref:HEPN domain-containing protein n=1 Tax=Sphingomonas pollutisoli TaxID=3030829 RepID=UPI0023BA2A9D|nr:HEPN domain-containing protein [Sphingomonas pollutisoli]MDF0489015.1 HEPN domain-containing protein [Sphingomonas pollutisoli]